MRSTLGEFLPTGAEKYTDDGLGVQCRCKQLGFHGGGPSTESHLVAQSLLRSLPLNGAHSLPPIAGDCR